MYSRALARVSLQLAEYGLQEVRRPRWMKHSHDENHRVELLRWSPDGRARSKLSGRYRAYLPGQSNPDGAQEPAAIPAILGFTLHFDRLADHAGEEGRSKHILQDRWSRSAYLE